MDNIELLKQYKQLLDEGLITQEEYNSKKQQLLNGITKDEPAPAPVTPVTPVTPVSGTIPPSGAQAGNIPNAGGTVPAAPISAPAGISPKPKKKSPLIAIIAAAVVLLLVVGGIAMSKSGGSSTSSDTGSDDSYTTDDSSGSDDSYSSDNSYGSDNSYSGYGDGYDEIQGYWYLDSVIVDGEETKVTGTAASGSLDITGKRWSMTLTTTETTYEGGDYEAVKSTTTDSGKTAYLYKFYSDTRTGSIEAIYMPDQNMLCLSTGEEFDSNNLFAFAK